MTSPNKIFDRIYCINLDRRADRWKECVEEFARFHLDVKRFRAIEMHNGRGKLSKGQWGCLLSHLNIIQEAKSENLKSILVLEDDVYFDRDFETLFPQYYAQVPSDWEFLYLGGNHSSQYGGIPIRLISENVGRMRGSFTTHAYAMKQSLYDAAIANVARSVEPVDVCYSELHEEVPSYCFTPNLAGQRDGFSDINESIVNYSHIIPVKR